MSSADLYLVLVLLLQSKLDLLLNILDEYSILAIISPSRQHSKLLIFFIKRRTFFYHFTILSRA